MIDGAEVLKRIEKSMADWPYLAQCPEYTYEMLESAHKLLEEQESVIEALKYDLSETLAVLGEQPEIVRCADCRKKDKEECPMYVDYPCTNKPGSDWFCAEGERKSDG